MKIDNRVLIVVIGAIGLYATFLILSDFNVIFTKLSDFRFEFLALILAIVPLGWGVLYFRWFFLLKNFGIHIPHKKNFPIFLSAFALTITPGKLGDLIKSQLLKNQCRISRKKTAPLVVVERLYDLFGAVVVALIGVTLLGFGMYVVIGAGSILILLFLLISSRKFFNKCIKVLNRVKFFRKFLEPISESYEILRSSCRGKILITTLSFSIVYWLAESLAVYFILFGFDIQNISYITVVSTYVTSLILGAASFLPGGLGVAEGSLVGLFNYQGVEISESFVLVVMIRTLTMWYSVIVGFLSLKFIGGLSSVRN